MKHLSNKSLKEAYETARKLNLKQDFIDLLESEIKQRAMCKTNLTKNKTNKSAIG